jgi:hypothetical protein
MIAWQSNVRGAVKRLDRLTRAMQRPEALLKALGREGGNRLQKHFRAKDAQPNKLSPRREQFWLKVGKSVTPNPVVDAAAGTVTLSITDPRFAQKVFGGVIRAKRVRNLTIPLVPAAYGRSPHTFEQKTGAKLVLFMGKRGPLLGVKLASGQMMAIYKLTPSVNQKADPTALPDRAEFMAALGAQASAWIQRQLNGGNQS